MRLRQDRGTSHVYSRFALSATLSRPARSLRADHKARAALMLYFNTNLDATPLGGLKAF